MAAVSLGDRDEVQTSSGRVKLMRTFAALATASCDLTPQYIGIIKSIRNIIRG